MIKGVNRQVVEITQTQCEYFEKVLFFIKPEYSAVSEGDLRERATIIAQSAGMPPAVRLRKNKLRAALNMSVAENILLSSTVAHSKGKPFMNWREVKRIARETLARMDLDIDINKRASEIPLAQRQMVLIARAIVELSLIHISEPTRH